MIDLSTFNNTAEYVIFDDFDFEYMPNKKSWWGAQQEFTATDKYTKKKTITWGKPCIYLCNPEDDPSLSPKWNVWFSQNSIRVDLINKLF
jgi:uncharacterized Rossmann fold enzyme